MTIQYNQTKYTGYWTTFDKQRGPMTEFRPSTQRHHSPNNRRTSSTGPLGSVTWDEHKEGAESSGHAMSARDKIRPSTSHWTTCNNKEVIRQSPARIRYIKSAKHTTVRFGLQPTLDGRLAHVPQNLSIKWARVIHEHQFSKKSLELKTYQISDDRFIVIKKNLIVITQKDSDKAFEFSPIRLVFDSFLDLVHFTFTSCVYICNKILWSGCRSNSHQSGWFSTRS